MALAFSTVSSWSLIAIASLIKSPSAQGVSRAMAAGMARPASRMRRPTAADRLPPAEEPEMTTLPGATLLISSA